jgi:hypothetical protein
VKFDSPDVLCGGCAVRGQGGARGRLCLGVVRKCLVASVSASLHLKSFVAHLPPGIYRRPTHVSGSRVIATFSGTSRGQVVATVNSIWWGFVEEGLNRGVAVKTPVFRKWKAISWISIMLANFGLGDPPKCFPPPSNPRHNPSPLQTHSRLLCGAPSWLRRFFF